MEQPTQIGRVGSFSEAMSFFWQLGSINRFDLPLSNSTSLFVREDEGREPAEDEAEDEGPRKRIIEKVVTIKL